MTAIGLSDVLIANLALTRIGSTQRIQAFTDQSNEAVELNNWYFFDRDVELTDWPWPFAAKYIALNQVSTTGIPACPEWVYSYRYPPDCLSVRRLVQGSIVTNAQLNPPATTASIIPSYVTLSRFRQDGDPCPWPFEIQSDATGRLLMTDCPTAWIRYTRKIEDATLYSPDFADLLAWRVASDLYGLARADGRREYCEKQYQHKRALCRARMLNEQQNDQPEITYNAESIRARQY